MVTSSCSATRNLLSTAVLVVLTIGQGTALPAPANRPDTEHHKGATNSPSHHAAVYPPALHGIWMPESTDAHQVCAKLRKHWDADHLHNALQIDPARLIEVSEGERSFALPKHTLKTGPGTWRITEEFHVNGDEAAQDLLSTYSLSATGRRLTHRFPFTVNHERKEGTRRYFKCL